MILLNGIVLGQNYSILFLGNSYTAANDLPGTIYNLAASAGDTIIYDSNTPGGYSFMMHSTDTNSLDKISSAPWDFVVLQAQSQEPSFPYDQFMTNTYPYAIILDSLIHANDSCSQTIFYMTWGRKYGDSQWDSINTFEKMNSRLRSAYLKMGEVNQAVIAPIGAAWSISWNQNQTLDLWSADNSHPSIAGTYLNACVFYSTLWHRSPVGLTYTGGLNQAEALFLQQIAAQVVLDSIAIWGIGVYDPWIAFNFQNMGSGVQFQNLTLGAQIFEWDFGDGTFSLEINPYHVYASDGSYQVFLTGTDSCQSRTIFNNVLQGTIDVPDSHQEFSSLSPNPFSEDITIHCNSLISGSKITIYTSDGRLVLETIMELGSSYKVNTSLWPVGIYYFIVESSDGTMTMKACKMN